MHIERFYIGLIADHLRRQVAHFEKSGQQLLGSQYNQETAIRRLEEARRLEATLAQVESLLQSPQEFFTLQ